MSSTQEERSALAARVERLEVAVVEARARLEERRVEADGLAASTESASESRSDRIAMGMLASSWGLAFLGYVVLFVGQCASCAANSERDHTYRAIVVSDDGDASEVGNDCDVVLGYARGKPCRARLQCGTRQLFAEDLACEQVEDVIHEKSWVAISDGALTVDPNHGVARWTSGSRTLELLIIDHDEDSW